MKTMRILKINPAFMLLIGLMAAWVSTAPAAHGADWQNFVLSGTFSDAQEDATDRVLDPDQHGQVLFKNYARGSGLTSYALASGKPMADNSGDLILLVGFTVPGATAANFSLTGEKIVDLGPLTAPPAKIKLPKRGWFSHPYTGARKMVVGNYYYVAQSGRHCLIQPMTFEVSKVEVTDTNPGAFGYTIHSAECALKARFLSASTIDGLQQLIKDLPAPKSSP
jgi:hypothetical protein